MTGVEIYWVHLDVVCCCALCSSRPVLESGFSSAGTQSEASLVPSNSSIPIWKEVSYTRDKNP